jgi:DNA repair exonuclease SbcCD ATPase subunit
VRVARAVGRWHERCFNFAKPMMPSLAEIVFNCTLCNGPLIAWETDAGRTTDCPHCLKPLTIPTNDVEIVNKDTFCEPMGLRRILQEVRDSEWENIRRKLQESKARVAGLEAELRAAHEKQALAAAVALGGGDAGAQLLTDMRRELAEMAARADETKRAVAATRQQHEVALDRLREALETLRAEVGPLREENAGMLRLLGAARAELDVERKATAVAKEELVRKERKAGRRSGPVGGVSGGASSAVTGLS